MSTRNLQEPGVQGTRRACKARECAAQGLERDEEEEGRGRPGLIFVRYGSRDPWCALGASWVRLIVANTQSMYHSHTACVYARTCVHERVLVRSRIFMPTSKFIQLCPVCRSYSMHTHLAPFEYQYGDALSFLSEFLFCIVASLARCYLSHRPHWLLEPAPEIKSDVPPGCTSTPLHAADPPVRPVASRHASKVRTFFPISQTIAYSQTPSRGVHALRTAVILTVKRRYPVPRGVARC